VQEPTNTKPSIMQEFEVLPDPRRAHRRAYPLQEDVLVALCTISSNADEGEEPTEGVVRGHAIRKRAENDATTATSTRPTRPR